MEVAVHAAMADIDADRWNQLAAKRCPFLRHEFLELAESTGCVSLQTGWTPRHLTIATEGGRLRAAMPLYEKSHSWGEFVFDWAWANAYAQHGLEYYPKLVSAIPFTPASSRRLLLANDGDDEAAGALLQAAVALAGDTDCSSLHIQFPDDNDIPTLQQAGMLLRKDCQFHWHNNHYRDFNDFLTSFTSRKRKKANRDRRKVAESGIRFERMRGDDIDAAAWSEIFALISRPFLLRGNTPYFSEDFFKAVSHAMPESILVIAARLDAEMVAAAVFFESEEVLYGRYWGSNGRFDALHFETCYYQGIEYCIDTGKQRFEPGTQGEHKISRGFTPVATHSAHWLAHAEFANAIERYLDEEQQHVDSYIVAVDEHTPFRKTDAD